MMMNLETDERHHRYENRHRQPVTPKVEPGCRYQIMTVVTIVTKMGLIRNMMTVNLSFGCIKRSWYER